MNQKKTALAAFYILLAIVLGAFGAHALKEVLPTEKLISFETGVRYQMYMGIALLVLALNESKFNFNLKWVWLTLLIGISLFSISIYLLSLQDVMGVNLKFLFPITPLGGVLMIVGWGIFIKNLLFHK